jgi:uncharacterized protein (DUF1499 family)
MISGSGSESARSGLAGGDLMTNRRRRMAWTLAIILGASVLGWIVVMLLLSFLARRPDTLGVRAGRLAACPASPNCVCSLDTDGQHAIAPLTFTDTPEAAWERLRAALARQPRCRIVTDEGGYLHAEFTSLLFRFVDDAEFHLDAATKTIQLRSASRAGRGDLGVNRARVEAIRAAF